jgi:hypothetical protein
MSDTFFVRGFQGLGDLLGDLEGFFPRERALLDARAERVAGDQLHDEGSATVEFF